MKHFTERPCAADGYISYRLATAHGYVMIGAKDDTDAMREARRSTDKPGSLQVWDGEQYVAVDRG